MVKGVGCAVAVKPLITALERAGVAVDPVLHAAHLSREALASAENRVPWASIAFAWEEAARAARDPAFGTHAAATVATGDLDIFDYLMSAAPTVGEGFLRLTSYVRLLYDRSNLRLVVDPEGPRLVRHMPEPTPQYDEFLVSFLVTRSRQSTGRTWTPERVSFQHARSEGSAEVARLLGAPIVFGASELEVRFAAPIMDLPHVHADSRLLALLVRYADSLLKSLPPGDDLVARASAAIARQMATRLPSLTATAAALRVSERSLQRRLADRGSSHSELVDGVRRELALEYIAHADLGIGEIAYLLHFGDPTAFHRAFKRWTGEAPLQYRRRLFPG
jgi:AraC-like DNA-binding protein